MAGADAGTFGGASSVGFARAFALRRLLRA
jgi:hypothetical protein